MAMTALGVVLGFPLLTSIAMRQVQAVHASVIVGVLPLATASGAGSGAQRAIGTGVLGGMVVGTVLGIFLIPLFFVVVQSLFGRRPHSTGA